MTAPEMTQLDDLAEVIGEFVHALTGDRFRTDADEVERFFLPDLRARGLMVAQLDCIADGSHSDDLTHANEVRHQTGRHAPKALEGKP